MRSEPYCCACGVESCRCGAGGKVAEMDNEQVRVCRCCGEAETHRDGCREMMAADPLHGPRRVWDRQKAEMSAGEAVRVRSIFGLYGEKVDRTVLSSAGHASKQAMLDADQVNMARNDLIERVARATRCLIERVARRCPSCGCYDGSRHHADCGSAEPHSLNDHPPVKPAPAAWAHRPHALPDVHVVRREGSRPDSGPDRRAGQAGWSRGHRSLPSSRPRASGLPGGIRRGLVRGPQAERGGRAMSEPLTLSALDAAVCCEYAGCQARRMPKRFKEAMRLPRPWCCASRTGQSGTYGKLSEEACGGDELSLWIPDVGPCGRRVRVPSVRPDGAGAGEGTCELGCCWGDGPDVATASARSGRSRAGPRAGADPACPAPADPEPEVENPTDPVVPREPVSRRPFGRGRSKP
jgi:hypothetical protein